MTVAAIGSGARRAALFGQGNILAFPQTVIGIFHAIPDFFSSKSTPRERSYAAIDIVAGVGGIGKAFSNTISLQELIKTGQYRQMLNKWDLTDPTTN